MRFIYICSLLYFNIINFNSLIFFYSFNYLFFFQYINSFNSNLRSSNCVQKNRSLVNFSTKKLYKQKGTGRARVGSASSPTRKGGARAFPGVFNESYKCKINKFVYRSSLKMIFLQYYLNDCFILIEDFFFLNYKNTSSFIIKKFLNKIFFFNTYKSIMLSFYINKLFYISLKNFLNFKILNILNFNLLDLLKFSRIYLTVSSLSIISNLLI